MTAILLIDDSEDIGAIVNRGLSPYIVRQVHSIEGADVALKNGSWNLFLIDVGLPDGSGFDLCLRLSQHPEYENVPKIMLTGRDQSADKVYGFNCGADDYLTKPFDPIELKARVDRYLRKLQSPAAMIINYHSFSFDVEFQRCFLIDGNSKTDLGLTPTEFRLFLTLAKSEGRVLTRNKLEQSTWEPNGTAIQIRGIDTHIAHLRKKLGPLRDTIISIYGQGYTFKSDSQKKQAA